MTKDLNVLFKKSPKSQSAISAINLSIMRGYRNSINFLAGQEMV